MFIFRQCLNEDMLGPWITTGDPSTKYSACNCTDGIQVIGINPKEREFGGKPAGWEWGSVGTWYSKSHLSLSGRVDFVLWIMTECTSLGIGKETNLRRFACSFICLAHLCRKRLNGVFECCMIVPLSRGECIFKRKIAFYTALSLYESTAITARI